MIHIVFLGIGIESKIFDLSGPKIINAFGYGFDAEVPRGALNVLRISD